jgi:hypothetical protein
MAVIRELSSRALTLPILCLCSNSMYCVVGGIHATADPSSSDDPVAGSVLDA